MTDKIKEAVQLCENIDFELWSEFAHSGRYAEIVQETSEKGKSEEDILKILGEEISETVNRYLIVSEGNARTSYEEEDEYKVDVYADSNFYSEVKDGNLELFFECSSETHKIKEAEEICNYLQEALDEAVDRYYEEKSEDEEYDYEE